MVMTHAGADGRCFVIRPDSSVHWKESVRVYLLMSGVCLGIGLAFAAMGFWPVLPFAGLEVLALGAALYVSGRRGRCTEVVRVQADGITIEKGCGRPQQRWQFQPLWSEVLLRRSGHPWYPSRLLIRSAGQVVELGAFLTDLERRRLAGALQRCVGPMARHGAGPEDAPQEPGPPETRRASEQSRRVGDGLE